MPRRGAQVVRTTRGSLGGKRTPELLTMPARHEWYTVLAVNLSRLLARVLWWLVRHPLVVLVASAFVASLAGLGRTWTSVILVGLAVIGGAWWWRFPASFTRYIAAPLRGRWRPVTCYQRHWQPAMVMTRLARDYGATEYLPSIKGVVSNRYADRVLVQLLAGQSPAEFEKVTEGLAHTFGARRCTVRVERPGRVWLEFFHADALEEPLAALPVPAAPDFTVLALGRLETGGRWVLRLLGSHLLIAGATGSGKGSVLWSIVRALAEGVRTRSVLLWGIDPKGGMELTFGRQLFDRLAFENTAGMLRLLEDAVAFMRERQARLLGLTRLHQPTVGDPLLVLVVDELAALIAYTDRDTKRKASELLQLLLSQGRAVGVVVVAAVQDPSKDIVSFRDLFPTRIALRLVEDVQVDMVLGKGARERGAECDKIPESLPGVGYVVLEGVREPLRMRAAYVSDLDLIDMGQRYAPDMPNPLPAADLTDGRVRWARLRWLLGRPETA